MVKKEKSQKMPKFTPAPERIVTIFHQNVDGLPNIELRKMFGYPSAFINGRMLAGVFADRIMLRLSEEDRKRIMNLNKGKPFEPMAGRPMQEYVELSDEVVNSEAEFNQWLVKALEYVSSLPPKIKKRKTSR